MSDAAALSKAFGGARAAYLMLPPITSREDQERQSDAIAKAVKESGLRYAVHLSSYGAQVPEGTGPVTGLHSSEEKLNAINHLNVLHLRAAYFMENTLTAIDMIHGMELFGHALLPDLKLPMIATRDVGDYAAQRLLDLDFSGKQTRELLGERDLSMTEATAVIARGIGKPDLRYEQFPYDQVQQALTQMGFSPRKAAVYIEMFQVHQCGSPRCAGAAFAAEQHADFVRTICAGCLCGRVSRAGYNRLGRRSSSHRLLLFVDQNFVKQLMRIADAEI